LIYVCEKSGYAAISCSPRSRPSASSSSLTRTPSVYFSVPKMIAAATIANATTLSVPTICALSVIVPVVSKMAQAMVPHTPQTRCTDMAPTGSSILILSKQMTAKYTNTPAIAPMMIEPPGLTISAPAVIATSPASTPLSAMERSGFPPKIHDTMPVMSPPAAAARHVVTNTSDTLAGSALSIDPPLNPNHPNHSRKHPMVAMGMLCPGIGLTLPFLYFPSLGPSRKAQTSAAAPPTACTAVDPARSWKPVNQLVSPPQTHEPVMGYAIATNKTEKSKKGPSLTRSATAPETMVAAVAANIPWNKKSVKYV